jgi:hypothetical protein
MNDRVSAMVRYVLMSRQIHDGEEDAQGKAPSGHPLGFLRLGVEGKHSVNPSAIAAMAI